MDKLLSIQYIDYINKIYSPNIPPSPSIDIKQIKSEVIDDTGFDIQDKKNTIKQPLGTGSATYQNPESKIIAFIDYENFLNQLSDSNTKGMKRCDFIVYDMDKKTIFLLNELSQSSSAENKMTKAKQQLHDTLQHLCKVDEIKSFIDCFDKKLCIFSNKTTVLEKTPDNMADAFIIIQKYLPDPVKHSYHPINKLNFELIETALVAV